MEELDRYVQWIEGGKQLGIRFSFEQEGSVWWSSVAIQKWQNEYLVYTDKIEEKNMAVPEEYLRETVHRFCSLSEAVHYIHQLTAVSITHLKPCKGQKVFYPGFS